MALDLRDLRTKVSVEAYAWLEARSRITGQEISAIVRDLLDEHIKHELAIASLTDQLLRREGLPGVFRAEEGNEK